MMNRFELGGCCLARYGAATPYFASKTDQIMSKYRPIAPKPVAQSTGGVVDAVQPQRPQPQPLAPPVESSRFRTCARSRKRSFDAGGAGVVSAPSSRGHKRAARSRGNVSKATSACASAFTSASEGGRQQQQQQQEKQNRLERGSPKSSVVLAVSSINQTTALRPHSDTSEGVVSALCEISDSAASKNFSLGRPCPSFGYSPPPCTSFDSTLVAQKNDGLLDKDAAFMERAAASASPNVNLPERRPTSVSKSKQGVMSSEIVPQQPELTSDMQASAVDETDPLFDPSQRELQPRQLKQDLITLPLLPIAPYRRESPSSSCVSNLSSRESNCNGNGYDNSIHPAFYNDDGQSLSEFSHFHSNACSNKMGMVTVPAPRSPLVDISLLEQLYSASSDPLLLTDDSYSHRVIWCNQAYKRLVSASEVGIPKPIASFILHKQSPFSSSLAVLWGFAEKLCGGHDMESTTQSKRGVGVIMPQPLRPVWSSVVIECITDTNLQASPMSGSIREVEEQLESQNFPSLISDSNNRVRWTNTAYKQMVGQPECSWLESPATSDNKSVKAARIHGEVLLVFNLHRFQLSEPLAAFSCCVKIQWTNGGEKSSMTVPCDVVRINGESHDYYAWQFDIQAALCL